MLNLQTALAEIKRAEAILRSRYFYEHPIFGHLATARDCVEAELAAAAPVSSEPLAESEPEIEEESAVEPPVAEPAKPPQKRR
jgi:hypothetical protein